MAEKKGDAAPEYPINQQLIEDATQAREEWRVVKDRLSKIEEQRKKVSDDVYQRVRKDYENRLKDATATLIKKKEEIDREVHALTTTRNKINAQLEGHRKKLEEIKFRNILGEYHEEEYQKAARAEQDKISKFEIVQSAVAGNIERYESIFEGEDELFTKAEPHAEEISDMAEVSGPGRAPHEKEPVTDAAGYVIEEEGPDYFGAAEEETSPELEESATAKAPPDLKRAKEAKDVRPRVAIISGDNAGAAYPLKGMVSFGRAESNTIALKDAKVSRQHAQIQQQGNEYILVDLNSSNGTYVNGERIEEHVLSNGDEIQIGDTVLQFQA